MFNTFRQRFICLTLVGLCACPLGCSSSASPSLWAHREQNMQRTFRMIEVSEARRPEQLARTFDMIDKAYQRDVERTARHPELFRKCMDAELTRWERNAPYNERIADDLIAGDPDNIEPTLIKIFD